MSPSAPPGNADRPTACVSAADLRALLAGDLSPDVEAAVMGHLETCPSCERVALELSDDPPTRALLAEHRRVAPGTDSESADLDEIRERLHVLGWFQGKQLAPGGNGSTQAAQDGGTQADGATGARRGEPPPAPTVGKFEIIELLGGGGFGMVYLARDRTLNRQVALKLARSSVLADPDLKNRFVREAEALARLEHPGIIPVYEAGEHEGTCYLAVSYCDGPTLEQWLREEGEEIEPKLAARIALALAEAVQHAHQHGILHRDIKPSNILLDKAAAADESRAGLPFTPKLTDFGLAKIAEQSSDTTLSGVVLGTLQYMATEQAAGLVERIGPPTDVYSLGAVLYEMLTGRPPIRGQTPIDTLRRVLVEEPASPRHLAKAVPDDLDAIVMRCLDKSPTRRYDTAGELADDLKRFLAGRPTIARPLSYRQRALRWVQRNQALSAVLALALLVVVLGTGLLAYDRRLKSIRIAHEQQQAEAAYRDDVYTAGLRYRSGDLAQAVELLQRQRPTGGRKDLRGLEWHYLWALTTRETFAETQVAQDVYQLCVSPGGDQLAAASMDHKLHLLDPRTLAEQAVIAVGPDEVNGVAYSPDGGLIATADDGGFIRLWDAHTHAPVNAWRAHEVKAFGVVFYEEGRKLASCGEEPAIRLWDAKTGQSDGLLEGHTAPVEAIVLSPVEELLASASEDHEAIVWDLAAKEPRNRLLGHRDKLTSVAFSPDGKWLATGGQDCAVFLWRHAAGRWRSNGKHLDEVHTVAFTHDGRLIAGDRGGTIRTYWLGRDFPTVALEGALQRAEDQWFAHAGRVWSLAMSPDADRFISSGRDGHLRGWQRDQHLIRRWKTDGDHHYDADYSRDGSRLFCLRQAAGVQVFDAANGESKLILHFPGMLWDSLTVLKGCDQVAAASQTGDVMLWNWGKNYRVHAWKFGDQPIQRIAYSPAANLLALIAYSREDVQLVDANSGDLVATLPAPSGTDCDFSPDGTRLAVDTLNKLAIYDIASRRLIRLAQGHTGTINQIAYSPDGQLIATASSDRTAGLWTADGQPLAAFTGHATSVFAVAFTPDGRSLVTGGDDGQLRFYNIATRRELINIPTGLQRIRRISISPNGRQIALIGDDWEAALISIPGRGDGG